MSAQDHNIARIKAILRRLGTAAKKGLGQNFLVDEQVLEKLLDAAAVTAEDAVIEAGPGLGMVTQALARRAGMVVAVELDELLASELERSLKAQENVRVVRGDILTAEPWNDLPPGRSYKVVANLPYNVASPTLRRFLSSLRPPSLMVVMVQKEVAQEIAAQPGKMRLLSVMMQFYAVPEIVTDVPPDSFYPPPKVNSAILRLIPHADTPAHLENPEAFFDFVAAGFRQPRKQLSNSLAQGLGIAPSQASAYLVSSRIDPHRRAETLSLEEWATLWRNVKATRVVSPPHEIGNPSELRAGKRQAR